MVANDQLDLLHDDQPLTLPFRPILEAMIEPFFDEVHCIMPIFCKQIVCDNIDAIYGGHSTGSDHAWKICLNNIILLTLIPQTHQRHSYHSAQSSNMRDVMHSEASLIMPFAEKFETCIPKS